MFLGVIKNIVVINDNVFVVLNPIKSIDTNIDGNFTNFVSSKICSTFFGIQAEEIQSQIIVMQNDDNVFVLLR